MISARELCQAIKRSLQENKKVLNVRLLAQEIYVWLVQRASVSPVNQLDTFAALAYLGKELGDDDMLVVRRLSESVWSAEFYRDGQMIRSGTNLTEWCPVGEATVVLAKRMVKDAVPRNG